MNEISINPEKISRLIDLIQMEWEEYTRVSYTAHTHVSRWKSNIIGIDLCLNKIYGESKVSGFNFITAAAGMADAAAQYTLNGPNWVVRCNWQPTLSQQFIVNSLGYSGILKDIIIENINAFILDLAKLMMIIP